MADYTLAFERWVRTEPHLSAFADIQLSPPSDDPMRHRRYCSIAIESINLFPGSPALSRLMSVSILLGKGCADDLTVDLFATSVDRDSDFYYDCGTFGHFSDHYCSDYSVSDVGNSDDPDRDF